MEKENTYPAKVRKALDKRLGYNTPMFNDGIELGAKIYHENCNNLTTLAQAHTKWSLSTFPDETAATGLKKLESEVNEIWEAISNRSDFGVAEEYADAIMCLFSSAAHLGVTPEMIADAFATKIEVNKERRWVQNPDGTHSHVKEEVPATDFEPKICERCGKTYRWRHCPEPDCLPF